MEHKEHMNMVVWEVWVSGGLVLALAFGTKALCQILVDSLFCFYSFSV